MRMLLCRGSQSFGHTLGGLAFADKCIGDGGERDLLTGIKQPAPIPMERTGAGWMG